MTGKKQTLYALMENQGYSYGFIMTAVNILGQSKLALDEMIIFIDDFHPTEEQCIEHLAEICSKEKLH